MPNILTLTGSPIEGSSTDILLNRIADGVMDGADGDGRHDFIRLGNLDCRPCQACGESPEPDYCLFHDEIYPVYDKLINSDIILFGSPIYFDSVSAQAKTFIDRCNCLRPPDFTADGGDRFKNLITKKRAGAMVLVGGERGYFEGARRVIAGFFKWTRIENCGLITYAGARWTETGAVAAEPDIMAAAFELGRRLCNRQTNK